MITKRFSKFLILTVCIILVFAVAAALLFGGSSLPANDNVIADSGESAGEVSGALVSNTGYIHGSNVKNNTTAEAVNTSSAFVSAIQNNKTIRLTGSFTLSSAQVQNIWNKTYTGTIYGNGNKITVSFPTSGNGISVTSSEHKAGFGGLCGKLTGAIYDLIFEHTGGQLNVRMTGNNSGFAGGLVGSIEGGTVENVKVILSNSSGGRVGFVKESSGSGWGSINYYVAAGALAGRIYSGTVRNVTVVNNAWIEAGVTSGSGSTSVNPKTPGHVGNIAGIIGPVQGESWSGSININNIIIEGSVSSASLVGQYTANIGTLTTSTNITVNNFYNKYKNTYDSETNGSSASFAVHDCSPTLTINNQYQDSGVTTVNSTADDRVSISSTVTVGTKYSVYFDPAATTLANSLVVVQTGVAGGDTKKAILTTNSGATYGDYAFADNGSTVIMRNLPTAISNWNNGGNFNCTISFKDRYVSNPTISGTYAYTGAPINVSINITYNGSAYSNYTLSYVANGNGAQLQDGKPYTPGNYIVRVTINGEDPFSNNTKEYQLALTVDKKTIQNPNMYLLNNVYDGTEKTPTFTSDNCGVESVNISYSGDRKNAGKFTAIVTPNSNHKFADGASEKSFELTIAQADVTVKADDIENQFANESPAYGYTVVSGQFYDTVTMNYACSVERLSNAGEQFDIVPSVGDFDGIDNYNITYQNGTLTVVPKVVEIAVKYPEGNSIEYSGVVTNSQLQDLLFERPLDINGEKLLLAFEITKDGEPATVQNVGTYTVKATIAESYYDDDLQTTVSQTNYTADASTSTLTVIARKINVTHKEQIQTSKIYDGQEVTKEMLVAMFEVHDTVEQGSYPELVVTVAEGTIKNAGVYNVSVDLNDYDKLNYELSDESDKTLVYTVEQIEVNGTLTAPVDRVYNGQTKEATFAFTGNSPMVTPDEIEIDYSTGEEQTVSNVVSAGTYTATASLPEFESGKSNYKWADGAVYEIDFEITALEVSVAWGANSFEYDGTVKAPTATATGVGQESVNIILTIKNAQSEVVPEGAVNAGNYTAEATTDNGNYTLTNATKEFEITKKEITVGVTVEDWTYGETASVPSVSGNDGQGEVTYLYVGQTNAGTEYSSATAPTDAGTYTLTVSIAQTQNYQAGEATSAQFTVNKKQVERPQADGTSFTYNGLPQTYNPVGYDADTMTVANNQQTNADTYQVEVSLKDTYNCEWATEGEQTETFEFTIAKKTLTDNTADVTGTYNATGYSLEIALNGFENGENLSTAGGVVKYGTEEDVYTLDSYSVKDATTAVTVYYQIVFANYVTVVGSGTITVKAKPIEVTWGDLSQSYTGEALKPTATVSQDDIEGDDVVTVSVKTVSDDEEVQAIDVGTYNAVATTQNANYELTNATVDNFVITAADFESAVNIAGWTYGDNANLPTVTYNPGNGAVVYVYNGTANDGTQLSDSQSAPEKAGSYTVTATIAANGNYAEKVVSADFTIAKKTVDVPAVEDKQYDGTLQNSGIVENEYYTVSDAGGKDIGPYTATLTLKDKDNYAWKSGDEDNDGIVEVGYEIVAQDVNINSWTTQPSITGWTYGGYTDENAPVYQAAYGNDTVDMQIRLKSGSDTDYVDAGDLSVLGAGVYLMKFSVAASIDPDGGESYTGLSAVVEFTVSKAAISVTVSIDGWTYGDVANKPTVGGITASEDVTYSYVGTGDTAYEESETAPVNAGTYKVTATVAETDNYFGATAEAEFTIAKKAVTATVTAENTTYDGAEHAAKVTFDGKVGEDELTANLLYNGEADVPVNAGSYIVTVGSYGGAAVDNYDITTKDGEVKLVISPKELYIDDIETAAADPSDNGIYDGKEHAVKATVKYGVLYGDDVVTLKVLYNGSEDAPVNAGNYTLTFVVTDNGNYVMAEDQSKTLPVFKAKVSVKGVKATATYTGEAFGKDAIIEAVFGDADLSLVNVTVTYRQGDAAVNTGDIADVAITLKDEANYEFAAETVTSYTFTVTAGTVRLDGEDKTVEYKGATYTEDEIKNAIFGEGTWADFVIKISYNNGAALNAGDTATVTVTGYSDENYALDPEMKTEYTFSVTTYKVAAPELSETSFVYNGGEQSVSLVDGTYVELSANVQTDKGDYKAVAAIKDKSNYEWITGGSADIELPWNITAKEITLKAETSVDKVYDGEAYDFSGYVVAGADGFFGHDNVTVTVSAGEIYTPGSYGITVTYDANANYNVTVEPTEAKLIINKATLTIGAKTAEIEYTGKVVTFEFEITGGKVGEDDVQIDGITYRQNGVAISPIEAGTYDVEFTLKGAQAGYYNAGTAQVKITPQTATAPDDMKEDSIILPEGDMIYNGEAHVATLNYEATDGNVYGIVYHNGTSYVDEAVNAGEYTVYIYKNTKTNIVQGISKTMTVEKRVITAEDISVGGLEFTYSGAANNKVTATGRGVKGKDVELVSLYEGEENAPVNAGTYTVTFRSADGNYTVAADVSYEMSVARASVVTPVAKNLTYNGKEQTAFGEDPRYTLGGTVNATDVSAEGYKATFTLVSDNYKWADHEQEKTINVVWNIAPYGVTIEISEAAKTKVYDGVALTEEKLKALFNAPDKIGGGKVDIAVSVNNGGKVLDAGVYTVTAEIKDINYTAATAEVTFTVTQATPVAEPDVDDVILQEGYKLGNVGISVKEGGTAGVIVWDEPETLLVKGDNEVTWTFTPEDTVNYTTLSGTVTLTVGDDVLDELVLVSGPEKTDYVAFEEFDGTGMLLKAVFNGGLKDQSFGVDKCRVVIENDVDGKMSAATTKVTVYYGEKFVEIEVNVSKITVTEPVLEVTELEYNAQIQTLPFEVGTDEKYYVKGGNTATDVGNYNLEIELSDKVNYVWSSGSSENLTIGWEITPVSLGVEIDVPEDLVYDGYGKEATFRLVQGTLYGGAQLTIVYEQNGKVIDGLPVNAGEYDVVVKLPDANNYRFASSNTAVMTIAKKVVTIKTNGDREKYYDGKEVTLEELAGNFTVSDGLKVKVTVSGTVLNAGSYKVTAVLDTANSNYTSNEVSYVYTVRKADRTVNATMSVGYRFVTVSVEGGNEGVEYSLDGFDWQPLDGNIAVELAAQYKVYVRYAESENFNVSAAAELNANITKDALMAYVEERFEGEVTLADAKDVAYLETLAEAATGENEEFDAKLAELSAKRAELVNGATNVVEKALKAGGALKGYAAAAVAVATTLGGISLIGAAVGLCVKTRKGGKKNEEK